MNNERKTTDEEVLDARLRAQAMRFLDAETAAIDVRTQIALNDARARAAEAATKKRWNWLTLGGTGLGLALAASLAVFAVLPKSVVPVTPGIDADTGMDMDVATTSQEDTAIADDLAFMVWLDENHDPS